MKKVAYADMTKYGVPPKHFNVVSGRFQGEAETGLKSFWMGMSHYLPGGGVEWSGEDSAEEKVYFVLEGELTVTSKDETFVLGPEGLALHRPERRPVDPQQHQQAGDDDGRRQPLSRADGMSRRRLGGTRTVNPIITASLTGPAATKKDTPAMPGNPEEIAEAAKGAYEAGAAVIHIHLRDNDDFTTDLDVARRTVELCREKCPGIVQLSTGGGFAYEDRMKIVEAKPAMATLNPATMTIGPNEFRNPPKQMLQLAERMLELGVKAEVEIYDTGHIWA